MNKIIFGDNQYCGPSVMSAIAGISTDQAAAVILSITGQRGKVKGVFTKDLIKAFSRIGYDCTLQTVNQSVFYTMMMLNEDGMYVLEVPGHFIAVEVNGIHKFICDNASKEPVNAGVSARLSQKVTQIVKVVKRVYIEPPVVEKTEYHYKIEFDLPIVNGGSMLDMASILKGALIMKGATHVTIGWETKLDPETDNK